jgi:hypothetical protein
MKYFLYTDYKMPFVNKKFNLYWLKVLMPIATFIQVSRTRVVREITIYPDHTMCWPNAVTKYVPNPSYALGRYRKGAKIEISKAKFEALWVLLNGRPQYEWGSLTRTLMESRKK